MILDIVAASNVTKHRTELPSEVLYALEAQAQAAVQQERKAIYDQWATAVTNFNAPNIADFHNWLSRRLREGL